jgi:hypothetical protein
VSSITARIALSALEFSSERMLRTDDREARAKRKHIAPPSKSL